MTYDITEETDPPRHLAVVRFSATPEQIPDRMAAAFGTVFGYLARNGVTPSGPPIGCYDTGSDTFVVRAGCMVDDPIEPDGDVERYDLPGGDALSTVHVGPYDDLEHAYEALQARAGALGRELSPVMWEEYLTGPEVAPEEMRTVIHWPLVG
jgi:effector-binding domain-containing protein